MGITIRMEFVSPALLTVSAVPPASPVHLVLWVSMVYRNYRLLISSASPVLYIASTACHKLVAFLVHLASCRRAENAFLVLFPTATTAHPQITLPIANCVLLDISPPPMPHNACPVPLTAHPAPIPLIAGLA